MTRYDQFLELQSQDTDECVIWPYATSTAVDHTTSDRSWRWLV